jgi:predicted nucleotidyltransferase
MAKTRQEIKKIILRFVAELQALGIEVSQVILFGSYAKGMPRDDSDIDVAVVSPGFAKLDIFERQELLSKAHCKVKEPLEPIGLTPKQVREKQGFARAVVESGVTVFRRK